LSSTAPTIPGGWTAVGTAQTLNGTSTADSYFQTFCKVAASSGETTGTFTSASVVALEVYRYSGTAITNCADIFGTPVVSTSTVNTTTTTVTYPSVTNHYANSWVIGVAYAPAATAGLSTAPTGMTTRFTQGTVLTIKDTNAGVSSYTSANVTVTGAGRVLSRTFEVESALVPTIAVTANAGTPTFVKGYNFTPTVSLTALANLQAQFSLANSGLGPALTAAAVPSLGTQQAPYAASATATLSVSLFQKSVNISESIPVAVTGAATATNSVGQTVSVSTTALATVQQATAWNIATAVTAGLSVTSFLKNGGAGGSFSLSPSLGFTANADLQVQASIANGGIGPALSSTMSPTFGSAQTATASATAAMSAALLRNASIAPTAPVTAAAIANMQTEEATPASVSTGATPANGIGWSLPTAVTTALSVTTFRQGVGMPASFSDTAAMTAGLQTAQSIPVSVTAGATAQQSIGWNIGAAVTAALSVTSFTKNAGSGTNFSLNPTLAFSTVANLNVQASIANGGLGPALTASMTVSQFLKTGGTNFPLNPSLGLTAAATVTYDGTNGTGGDVVNTAAAPQFGSAWSTPVSVTAAVASRFGSGWTSAIAVGTGTTQQLATSWAIPFSVTPSMTPGIVKNGGSSSYSMPVTLAAAMTEIPQFATADSAASSATVSVSAGFAFTTTQVAAVNVGMTPTFLKTVGKKKHRVIEG
jgi:hypothetical protein